MPELINFLLARIAEDEADADQLELCPYFGSDPGNGAVHISAARILAECETKRRIVDWCRHVEVFPASLVADGVLRLLALPYADHPDYQPEWRP